VSDWRPACSLEALQARAQLLRIVRDFFHARGILEVQTATLASATVTEPAVESIEVPGFGYLQTSPEYQLKRLLAAGAPSLYQLGPVYRAGETGRHHNPEFVMLEWYHLGYTDNELMAEVAELMNVVLGAAEFHTLTYQEVVALAPADLDTEGLESRQALDLRLAAGLEALSWPRCFVIDYPADQAALARLRPGNPEVAARFELVVDGLELANGYWELGDAAALQARFQVDLAVRRARGQPQPPPDPRFLHAMAAGLPPCAGVALGFDRLLMLRMKASSLREVMPFPSDRA
jgi:lysyl-tRNA synthetase class 2